MNATKTTHRHRPIKDVGGIFGFTACVSPGRCNPTSHGGVTILERCICGAERRTNSTGRGREETSGWIIQDQD